MHTKSCKAHHLKGPLRTAGVGPEPKKVMWKPHWVTSTLVTPLLVSPVELYRFYFRVNIERTRLYVHVCAFGLLASLSLSLSLLPTYHLPLDCSLLLAGGCLFVMLLCEVLGTLMALYNNKR